MDGGMEWDIFPKSNPPEPNLAIPPGLELKLTCLDFIFPEFSMKMRTKSARMLAEALFFPKLQKKKIKMQDSQTAWEVPRMMFQQVPLGYIWGRQSLGVRKLHVFDAALAGL